MCVCACARLYELRSYVHGFCKTVAPPPSRSWLRVTISVYAQTTRWSPLKRSCGRFTTEPCPPTKRASSTTTSISTASTLLRSRAKANPPSRIKRCRFRRTAASLPPPTSDHRLTVIVILVCHRRHRRRRRILSRTPSSTTIVTILPRITAVPTSWKRITRSHQPPSNEPGSTPFRRRRRR